MAGWPAVGRTSVARPSVAMSAARCSAAALQSAAKAGSAEIDLIRSSASANKWTLLIVSTLFYLWGEPVFVLLIVVSTAIDYALSFHLNDPSPPRMRRLALGAGIALNLAILVVYKYVDFLADNFNLLLAPLARDPVPLLHLALPIGVSFVVFEKITYLVDTYRGVSRRAASF